MKQLFLLCLITMNAIHAQAQKTATPQSRLANAQRFIMTKQLQAGAQQKTTGTAKRLIGYSRYDGAVMTDSAYHKYSAKQGSTLSDYFSYLGAISKYSYGYFDPADPLALQVIPSDSSIMFTHDGSSLVIHRIFASDYDSKRNLTHTLDFTEDETLERFITSNSSGLRETVIERDSGDGTLPYVDRWKHHFTYDNQNRVVTDSVSFIPTPMAYSKTYYFYNAAGLLTGLMRYLIDNGTPEQDYKMDFVYDGSNRMVSATDYYDFGSGWKPTNRFSYEYTGSASQYTKYMLEGWSSSNWSPKNGELYELNGSGKIGRRYRLDASGPVLDTLFRLDYTYNAAGLMESAQGAKYLGGGNYGPNDQSEHFYYEDYETSGIADKAMVKAAFSIYPNPASDKLFVHSGAATQYAIISVAGAHLMTIQAIKGTQSVDVSALPAGCYIIRDNASNAYQRFSIIH